MCTSAYVRARSDPQVGRRSILPRTTIQKPHVYCIRLRHHVHTHVNSSTKPPGRIRPSTDSHAKSKLQCGGALQLIDHQLQPPSCGRDVAIATATVARPARHAWLAGAFCLAGRGSALLQRKGRAGRAQSRAEASCPAMVRVGISFPRCK